MSRVVIVCEVGFVGGPLDGHRQQVTFPAETFVGVALVPFETGNLWQRFLAYLRKYRLPRRLAIYEIEEKSGRYQYRYVSTQLIRSTDLPELRHFGPNGQSPFPITGPQSFIES